MTGGEVVKKRQPWTLHEDAILLDYIKIQGAGNWNHVKEQTRLHRSAKSIRFRWTNHLNPALKKGPFSPKEEELIFKLHANFGNKWSQIAAQIPGRTDNAIKNYWNTRIKRYQHGNLPLYPPNTCFQSSNENQRSKSPSEYRACDEQHNRHLQPDNDGIPDISMSSMLGSVLGSQNYGLRAPINPVTCGLPTIEQFPSDTSDQIHRPFDLGLPYDPDPDPGCKKLAPFSGAIAGSHAILNDNLSTSQPHFGTGNLELPSLHYPPEADPSGWFMFPSLLEAVDAYVASPPPTVPVPCDFESPQNSGLIQKLDTKNQLSEKSTNCFIVTPSDTLEDSMLNLYNTDWKYFSDPSYPLGFSAASIFCDFTPPTISSSLDESATGKELYSSKVVSEPAEHISTAIMKYREISPQLELPMPDALLGSDWCNYSARDQPIFPEGPSTFLGEEFYGDCNFMPVGAWSSLCQQQGFCSCESTVPLDK